MIGYQLDNSFSPLSFFFTTIERLSENPYAIAFYCLSMMQVVALYFSDSLDPVLFLIHLFESMLKDQTLPKILKMIIYNLDLLLIYELQKRVTFVVLTLFFIPSFIKFSLSYLLLEIIFSLITIYSMILPLWYTVLLVHFWYIYVLNDQFPKFYLLLIILFFLYLGSQLEYQDRLSKTDFSSYLTSSIDLKKHIK